MARRMLIDATHPEETRVVAVHGNRLEEFDYETATKQQLKGNIYLAKVTRVEPSLQAAFVEYGGNRHGFLAFSEIHPDYYRIPVADREDLLDDDTGDEEETNGDSDSVEELGGDEGADEAVEESQRRRPRLKRHYKIQEVIKRRQVLLVQVIKEERGNKGAALTTYLSLAGRYCVLMPNTSRGGGVSRKISSPQDRKRLKSVLAELSIPDGMAVILRTAGQERSKAEIKRDYEYIMRMWDTIRETTLESTAPALIHEEANLIRRSIRDLYTKDIDEILVAGDAGYRMAKDFMKAMIPSHAKKVQPYKDDGNVPLFQRYQVEGQLNQIYDPVVHLRSGGSIVMHQTEALVAIDVNSGRATRERHIEETALKTNLEAAEEIARQLRLRDLAGLVVIDFIDMEENRNDHSVERKLKESLRRDRARIQVGRISPFGLLEMSRQRLRPSLLEAMTQPCPTCGGIGYIPSTESAALRVLRSIEEEGLRRRSRTVTVQVPPGVALYILNNKRATLAEMETNYDMVVVIETDDSFIPPHFVMSRIAKEADEDAAPQLVEEQASAGPTQDEQGKGGRRRGRGRRRKRRFDEENGRTDEDAASAEESDADQSAAEPAEAAEAAGGDDGDNEGGQRRRRKRGRRGGRRRRGGDGDAVSAEAGEAAEEGQETVEDTAAVPADADIDAPAVSADAEPSDAQPEEVSAEGEEKPARKRRAPRRRSAKKSAEPESQEQAAEQPAETEAETETDADAVAEPAAEAPDAAVAETADAQPADSVDAVEAVAEEEAPAKKPRRAKKAAAKRPRAKTKAAKAKPPAAEAPTEEAEKAPEPVSEETAAQPPVAEPAVEPAPVAAQPPANDPVDAAEPAADPNRPKRKGWWNRMIGS